VLPRQTLPVGKLDRFCCSVIAAEPNVPGSLKKTNFTFGWLGWHSYLMNPDSRPMLLMQSASDKGNRQRASLSAN
jgi:hypothetical protein